MVALRGAIHVACFIIHVLIQGVWRCLLADVVIGNTPLFFSARGIVANRMREKKDDNDAVD